MRRVDVIGPDLAPRKHWSKSLASLSMFGLEKCLSGSEPVNIVVPEGEKRLQSKYAKTTTYSGTSLPRGSFIEVMPGLAISCPELLFLEMAEEMDLPEHLMLGHELCGTFARDPRDPLNGTVALHLKPVTTKARLEAYCRKAKWARGAYRAQRTLDLLADNAWSPTESIVAAMASLPLPEFGYELDPLVMNERVDTPEALAFVTEAESRVPDILFGDSRVGINYDGAVHLDLDSIVKAAMDLGCNPGSAQTEAALNQAVQEVRAKAVDDIRRNRELAAAGYIVFPVVKEDLYEEGGLDRVMMQVIEALETYAHRDMSEHRRMMKSKMLRAKRQELIWSLLPGKHPMFASNREEALPYLYAEHKVREVIIGY